MLRWISDALLGLLNLLRGLFRRRRADNSGREHERGHERVPGLPHELGETTGGVGAGGTYVYVKRELVVGDEDRDAVLALLRELLPTVRWRELEAEPLEGLAVTRLLLPRGAPSVPELMDALRDDRATSAAVSPNHVLGWTSHPGLIPCGPPVSTQGQVSTQAHTQLEEVITGGSQREPAEEVLVGAVDTGVVDHPWLHNRCSYRDPEDLDKPDWDNDNELDYGAGHGTFIAGVILQYAPDARVVARRLQTTSTSPPPHQPYATDVDLAKGLVELSKEKDFNRIRVIVLAMGGYAYGGEGLLTTGKALQLCRLANPDLVVVAGAGNDDTTRPFFPAALKDVVAVAALADGPGDMRACFSNHGWWVDACAPGVKLVSTFPTWHKDMAPYPNPAQACQGVVPSTPQGAVSLDLIAEWRGTSFAAPIVAAWIAQRIATTGVTGQQAVLDLKGTIGAAGGLGGLGQWLPGLGRVVRPPF
jgi:hypothetical protein